MTRQQLTEAQIAALFGPLTDQRELVRHYTLSEADIAMIRRCRGDHSRLGYALMLCYLRHPGRPLHVRTNVHPRRSSHLSLSRSMFRRKPSMAISPQSKTAGVMPRSCRSGLGFVPSARARPPNWPIGYCRTQPRTIGWPIWPNWRWRNADDVGSSSRHPKRSNGSASKSVIGHDGRSNVG